ncbi:YIPF5-like protein [Mya arenaria]|uniref:YIPF5-like protein n=1 Tax=Mya arenaria TaxID=6604 RepID=A0ABY7DS20_MYAAR|nr:YIPF5-like protein [Mya arenaria]
MVEIIPFQTLAVLNPLKQTDHTIMQDTDLAGPLVFCLAFGGFLMLGFTWDHFDIGDGDVVQRISLKVVRIGP